MLRGAYGFGEGYYRMSDFGFSKLYGKTNAKARKVIRVTSIDIYLYTVGEFICKKIRK